MGNPTAKRLLNAGYSVTVWNRSRSKIDPLLTYGAVEGASPQSVAEDSDVLMIFVSDTAVVKEAVFGDRGICYAQGRGKVLIDFSSIDPESTRKMASDLANQTPSPTPVVNPVYELMKSHADQGYSDQGPSTLINMYMENEREG